MPKNLKEKPTRTNPFERLRLEKGYEGKLPSGGEIKIQITAKVDRPDVSTEEAVHEIGVAARDFYLSFGNQLNSTR
jgi:hypothetical protein